MNRPFNVLFLCTGNSARSIIAEALLRQEGGGRFAAYSAGSYPKGTVHPLAVKVLAAEGISTEGLRSKSWDEFAVSGAPELDFVFTVCDNAAGEACPIWPGKPVTAHWGVEDPAAAPGSVLAQEAAFVTTLKQMRRRISVFTALPFEALDRLSLATRLAAIGREADTPVT